MSLHTVWGRHYRRTFVTPVAPHLVAAFRRDVVPHAAADKRIRRDPLAERGHITHISGSAKTEVSVLHPRWCRERATHLVARSS